MNCPKCMTKTIRKAATRNQRQDFKIRTCVNCEIDFWLEDKPRARFSCKNLFLSKLFLITYDSRRLANV